MLKWYELFMSIYLSTIKNKLFFNVRIACLLNTAEKSVYLVGSYLQTYNPIVKSIFIISFFQHKKIQKPVWYYCSPVCFQSLKKEKNIFFFTYMLILPIIFMEHSASFPCFGGRVYVCIWHIGTRYKCLLRTLSDVH